MRKLKVTVECLYGDFHERRLIVIDGFEREREGCYGTLIANKLWVIFNQKKKLLVRPLCGYIIRGLAVLNRKLVKISDTRKQDINRCQLIFAQSRTAIRDAQINSIQ